MTDAAIHDCPDCRMRPGSDTAIEAGCTCGRLDNARGHRRPHNTLSLDCPVHVLPYLPSEDDQ